MAFTIRKLRGSVDNNRKHTQRPNRVRKAATKQAAVTAGREGTLGAVLKAARGLENFARHQA